MFQQAWPTILQQLQGSSRVLHSMVATYGSVAGFDGRTLTLAFSNTGPIVNLRNRPDLMNTLTGVLSQVAGSPIEVVLTEGGSNPNGGGSPKGERRPIPAPTPAPTKFTKAVSSAGAAARAAARAQAAAPAPQQRPASAVQTSAPAAPAPRAHEGYASSYDDVPPPAEEPYFDEPPFPDDPYYSPAGSVPVAPQVQPQQQSPAPATQPEPVAPAPATSAPRSFDGPPVAPKPRMTAGMAARQAEGGVPNIARPVSSTPLHPDSTTDSFENLAVDAPELPAPQTPERSVPEPAPAPAQPQVRPREQEQPRPEPVAPAPSPAAPAPAPEAAPRWGAPRPEPEPAPAASAPASTGRMSRYQQLMNQAKNAPSAPAPAQSARGWGGPASAPDPAPVQEPEEFVPSDDDIEVEDSALIGVPAVERLLGGMVIEQRDVNGNVVEIKRSL